MSMAEWAAAIAKQIPRAKYWTAEPFDADKQIGISVTVLTSLGPKRFAVRFPNPPTEDDLKQAAINLNGRIEQHAGEDVS